MEPLFCVNDNYLILTLIDFAAVSGPCTRSLPVPFTSDTSYTYEISGFQHPRLL